LARAAAKAASKAKNLDCIIFPSGPLTPKHHRLNASIPGCAILLPGSKAMTLASDCKHACAYGEK